MCSLLGYCDTLRPHQDLRVHGAGPAPAKRRRQSPHVSAVVAVAMTQPHLPGTPILQPVTEPIGLAQFHSCGTSCTWNSTTVTSMVATLKSAAPQWAHIDAILPQCTSGMGQRPLTQWSVGACEQKGLLEELTAILRDLQQGNLSGQAFEKLANFCDRHPCVDPLAALPSVSGPNQPPWHAVVHMLRGLIRPPGVMTQPVGSKVVAGCPLGDCCKDLGWGGINAADRL